MKLKELLKWNLQMFADDDNGDGDNGGENKGGDESKKDEKKGKEERSYNDADVDRIVAKHKAEWEKDQADRIQKAVDEKLKYQNADEEEKKRLDKEAADKAAKAKDDEIASLKAQIATAELRKTVAAEVEAMSEGITASQAFLDLVVTGDENTTKENKDALVKLILDDRKEQEKKRAAGGRRKDFGGNGGAKPTGMDAKIQKWS